MCCGQWFNRIPIVVKPRTESPVNLPKMRKHRKWFPEAVAVGNIVLCLFEFICHLSCLHFLVLAKIIVSSFSLLISKVFITGCHFLLILSRDAGPKCPVDNERLSEAQVIIDNSKLLDPTYSCTCTKELCCRFLFEHVRWTLKANIEMAIPTMPQRTPEVHTGL